MFYLFVAYRYSIEDLYLDIVLHKKIAKHRSFLNTQNHVLFELRSRSITASKSMLINVLGMIWIDNVIYQLAKVTFTRRTAPLHHENFTS